MDNIKLRRATIKDKEIAVAIDYRLDKVEHVNLNREAKITKAIVAEECFIIVSDNKEVGFTIFDYRFFDNGWIELIIIDEAYRGRGIGGKVFELLCEKCASEKVFTSTNCSNRAMQRALTKAGFSFAGELVGLDEGDSEYFYYKSVVDKQLRDNEE
jgi:GNAT superfamily N-acetyltransferase